MQGLIARQGAGGTANLGTASTFLRALLTNGRNDHPSTRPSSRHVQRYGYPGFGGEDDDAAWSMTTLHDPNVAPS
jgi:hypothetical protein